MSIDVLFSVVEVEVDSAWSPAPRRTPFRSLDAVYGETPMRNPIDAISPVRSVYDGLGSKIAELDDNNNMTTSRQYDVYGAKRAGTQQGSRGDVETGVCWQFRACDRSRHRRVDLHAGSVLRSGGGTVC